MWELILDGAGMLRALRLSIFLVLGWIALVTQAQAATYVFAGPGDTKPFDGGNQYSATHAFLGTATGFTHDYFFTLSSSGDVPLDAVTTTLVFAQPAGRVKNMVVSWLDPLLAPLASLAVTGPTGNLLATEMTLSLLSGALLGNYTLRVTGDAIATQIYNVAVATTPLPPALLLFGSALAGLGLLGRRRRRSANTLMP